MHLDDLPVIERDVIKILKTGKGTGLNTEKIGEKIEKETGVGVPKKKVYEGLSHLMRYGWVRSYEIDGEKKYYLSKGIGAGARAKAKLSGKALPFTDLFKYIGRIFGSIFMLFGIGFLVYQNLSLSGAVISNNSVIKEISPIFPLALIAVGALFFFKIYKK